jgi:hypothetical protein
MDNTTEPCRELAVVRCEIYFNNLNMFVENSEEFLKSLRSEVAEFTQFLQEHRSMRHVQLHIHTEYEERCAKCHCPWEIFTDEDPPYCAGCGRTVKQAD